MIGNTVKVLGRLEEAFRQEQPVNIRIKDICEYMPFAITDH
jgi:hypothetical protein